MPIPRLSGELWWSVLECILVRALHEYLFRQSAFEFLDQALALVTTPETLRPSIEEAHVRVEGDDCPHFLSYTKAVAIMKQHVSVGRTSRGFYAAWTRLRKHHKIPDITHGPGGASIVLKVDGADMLVPLALTITVNPWRSKLGEFMDPLRGCKKITPLQFVQACLVVNMEAALQGDKRLLYAGDIFVSGPPTLLTHTTEAWKKLVNDLAIPLFQDCPDVAFMSAKMLMNKTFELIPGNHELTMELKDFVDILSLKPVAWHTPALYGTHSTTYEESKDGHTYNLAVYLAGEPARDDMVVRPLDIPSVEVLPFKADERLKAEIEALTNVLLFLDPQRFCRRVWRSDLLLRIEIGRDGYFKKALDAFEISEEEGNDFGDDLENEANANAYREYLDGLNKYDAEIPCNSRVYNAYELASERKRLLMGQSTQTEGEAGWRFGAFKGPITETGQ